MSQRFTTRDGREAWLRPAVEDDAPEFIQAIDSIAREGRYFLRSRFTQGVEEERGFIAGAVERGDLILVAVLDARLAGWVTVFRARHEYLSHTGELGMGVIQGCRGIGIGTALIDYALKWASAHGFEKINLGVRASNVRARSLYRRSGFVEEGYRVREIRDSQGCYDDSVEMAYFVARGSVTGANAQDKEHDARTA